MKKKVQEFNNSEILNSKISNIIEKKLANTLSPMS